MTGEVSKDPDERVCGLLTDNAILCASRFCIDHCGIVPEAQHMALMASAMAADGVAVSTWEQGDEVPKVTTADNQPAPKIILECKGPRKKFLFAGEPVCRKSVSINSLD